MQTTNAAAKIMKRSKKPASQQFYLYSEEVRDG
jgi:hypothetical protein